MTPVEKLKEIIDRRHGGNQAAFARSIKRSPSQVNQWLSGYRKLDVKACRHIEISLNLPTDYFLGVAAYPTAETTRLDVREPPAHSRPLVQQACDLAEQINDDGLRELIGFAKCLTGTHPLAKAKRA